jgi:hypothetical protein
MTAVDSLDMVALVGLLGQESHDRATHTARAAQPALLGQDSSGKIGEDSRDRTEGRQK